jgi:hypothetical protein
MHNLSAILQNDGSQAGYGVYTRTFRHTGIIDAPPRDRVMATISMTGSGVQRQK